MGVAPRESRDVTIGTPTCRASARQHLLSRTGGKQSEQTRANERESDTQRQRERERESAREREREGGGRSEGGRERKTGAVLPRSDVIHR